MQREPTPDALADQLRSLGRSALLAETISMDVQRKESAELKSAWRTALYLSLFLVLALVLLAANNILLLKKRFPLLYCWYNSSYLPLSRVCSMSMTREYSARDVALKVSYPGLYDLLTVVGLPPLDAEFAVFLNVCVATFGPAIDPVVWKGMGDLQGNAFAVTLKNATKVWDEWKSSCKSKSSTTNPFLPLFPGDESDFNSVPSVLDFNPSSETNALDVLFKRGLCGMQFLFVGTGRSGRSGFNYLFRANETDPSDGVNCTGEAVSEGAQAAIGAAAGGAGISMGVKHGMAGHFGAVLRKTDTGEEFREFSPFTSSRFAAVAGLLTVAATAFSFYYAYSSSASLCDATKGGEDDPTATPEGCDVSKFPITGSYCYNAAGKEQVDYPSYLQACGG